jgi:hypothetical protein
MKNYHFREGRWVATYGMPVEPLQSPSEPRRAPHGKVHALACCERATVAYCVCIVSFTCPVHGGPQCYGSHD